MVHTDGDLEPLAIPCAAGFGGLCANMKLGVQGRMVQGNASGSNALQASLESIV